MDYLNISLVDFLDAITGIAHCSGEFAVNGIKYNYNGSCKAIIAEIGVVLENEEKTIENFGLFKFRDFLRKLNDTNHISQFGKVEIYKYFESLTDGFKQEKVVLALEDVEFYYRRNYLYRKYREAQKEYKQRGLKVPRIGMDLKTTDDIKEMIAKVHVLGMWENEEIRYAIELLKEKNTEKNKQEQREKYTILNDAETFLVLKRGVDAGFLDEKFMPIKGKMTRAQQKMFALYAGTELGIDCIWKTFQDLWKCKNLAQVREVDANAESLDAIKALFPRGVVYKTKYK